MRKGSFAVVLIVTAVVGFGGAVSQGQPNAPAAPYTPAGWDKDKRHAFYTTSIGIWHMPYDWFRYLEVPRKVDGRFEPSGVMFKDILVAKYGAIPLDLADPLDALNDPTFNPDGILPVGFIKSSEPVQRPFLIDRRTNQPNKLLHKVSYLGQTCASCHTGVLNYQDKRYRIDGGSGMFDVLAYSKGMVGALHATMVSDEMRKRFATRLGQKEEEVRVALEILIGYFNSISPLAPVRDLYPTDWGFGRGDAFGRGGNTTLGALIPNDACAQYAGSFKANCDSYDNANRVVADAPVSNPHIWNAWKYDRVEWNGSISNPMGRNIAQAITTSRRLFFKDKADPYRTDPKVDLGVLNVIERLVWDLVPPTWPQDFNPADPAELAKRRELAGRGQDLYANLCAKCHVPVKMDRRNTFDQDFIMNLIQSDKIGTDPGMADKFRRSVKTGALKQVLGGRDEASAREVMEAISSGMMDRAIKKREAPLGMKARPNRWTDDAAYLARPNVGIWATPPFLHNGSVPNLYLLLSPKSERDAEARSFCLGHFLDPDTASYDYKPDRKRRFLFDPHKVGYEYKPNSMGQCPGGIIFDTGQTGNSNAGHEYVGNPGSDPTCKTLQEERSPDKAAAKGVLGCEIAKEDREAIIEYLKVCTDC